jgi:hypothetical protein
LFEWASVKRTSCRQAATFMRAYAEAVAGEGMPRRMRGFRCRIRCWRSDEGDIYARRRSYARGSVAIRFYGLA